ADLAARTVIELTEAIAASIISLDGPVLKIPFVNRAGRVFPAGAPTAGHGCFRPDALGFRKSRQGLRRRDIARRIHAWRSAAVVGSFAVGCEFEPLFLLVRTDTRSNGRAQNL